MSNVNDLRCSLNVALITGVTVSGTRVLAYIGNKVDSSSLLQCWCVIFCDMCSLKIFI